jgi:hypothetical protein
MSLQPGDRLDALVVKERNDKKYFTKVGSVFVNKDSSLSVKLDALPMDGELYCRLPSEDERPRGGGQNRPKSNPQRGFGNRFSAGGGRRQQESTDYPDEGPIE